MPEGLKAAAGTRSATSGVRLWAEMLDLPETVAAPLLADPVAAAALFDRSPLLGNRYADVAAHPERIVIDASGATNALTMVIKALQLTPVVAMNKLFDGVIDPTSGLETG